MSIELVMPSNHLILCHPLLLWPSIFPSIRVFSNESVLLQTHLKANFWLLFSCLFILSFPISVNGTTSHSQKPGRDFSFYAPCPSNPNVSSGTSTATLHPNHATCCLFYSHQPHLSPNPKPAMTSLPLLSLFSTFLT